MFGSDVCKVLCMLLIPVPSLAQQPDTIGEPLVALTGGLGVSYVGVGALGEFYLGQPHLSVLIGAGGLGETETTAGFVGASLGARGYTSASGSSLYLEVLGAYVVREDDSEVYGPAVLAGYRRVARSGFTYNVGVGAGRATDESVQPAFNIGFGYTWRRYRGR